MPAPPSFAFTAQSDWLGYFATLPQAGSSWIAVLLRLSGLEADDTLIDYEDLGSLLAGSSDETNFARYERKTVVAVRTVRKTTNDLHYTLQDGLVRWLKAGSSDGTGINDTVAKAITCYKPSSTAADSAIKPLFATAIRGTTDGNDMTWRLPNGLDVIDSLQSV